MSTEATFTVRRQQNDWGTVIDVLPWADDPWAARVTVLSGRDPETGDHRITVRYGFHPMPASEARRWAQAILRACEIADEEATPL